MAAKLKSERPVLPPVMTTDEVCEYFRIGRTTIYRLIKAGEIPYFRLGSRFRFNREAIDEWCKLKQQHNSQRPAPPS